METPQELLEIYKLHVEMADRVSNRRLQTNCFYFVLVSGLLTLSSFIISKNIFVGYGKAMLIAVAVLGILLCVVWVINIHSYKQLNSGKFQVIHDLEQKLSYAFYTKEWAGLKKGEEAKAYFQLTKAETFVPLLMMLPYLFLLIWIFVAS